MSTQFRLADQTLQAFVPARDAERAKAFYRDTLRLPLVSEELPFALVFDAAGTPLRVTILQELNPAPFTVLGWQVPDIAAAVEGLRKSGVQFLRIPGLSQDDHGVWTAPGGAKVAWFKDPDGNTLSVSQHHRG